MKTALVLGSSGLIGSHTVSRLKKEGYWVRAVDIRHPEFHKEESDEFLCYDLRKKENVEAVMRIDWDVNDFPFLKIMPFSYLKSPYSVNAKANGFDEVYQYAADMGGAGYIFTGEHDADVMHNSVLINIHVAEAAKDYGVKKLFYSSSACIYPKEIQQDINQRGLRESDAWPANPDSDYGVEKIFSERLYLAYARNYGLNVRIARFHNIYGPNSPYDGVRAKAPAAICRKVIEQTLLSGEHNTSIEIWGDGEQARSFLYIDDCIDAVRRLMRSEHREPINIGSEEMVTINQLADIAIKLSGKEIIKKYDANKPQGVRGRNSNNDIAREVLSNCDEDHWAPAHTLEEGLTKTYKWIEFQIAKNTPYPINGL